MMFLKRFISILKNSGVKKRKLFILFFFLVLSLILESLSITLIIPIVSFFFSENSFDIGFLGYIFKKDFSLISSLIIFSILIALKNLFGIFLGYYRSNLSITTQINISKKIFTNIILGSYNKFTSKSQSEYLRNIFQETNIFSSGFMNPLLVVFSEFSAALGVIIIISIVNPLIFLFLLSISSIILFVFYIIIKKKIKLLGKKRQIAELNRLKQVNNAFDTFPITKIFNLENNYVSKYYYESNKVREAAVLNETIANTPKFFLELLMIVLFSLIIFYLKYIINLSSEKTLILLSLYGYAAFRIFPSVNRIMINLQNIQFSMSTLDLIYELTLQSNEKKKKKYLSKDFSNSIIYKNLYFDYGKKKIFENFNFTIKKNHLIGVRGESGVGKTTLINIIIGLLEPQKVNIFVDEEKIDINQYNISDLFSYVPQNNLLIDSTLEENIVLGQEKNLINYDRINEILYKLNLLDLLKTLPNGLETNIGKNGSKISGGQAQRICIARAIYYNRKIIILDEPTSSLDGHNENEIISYLLELKSILTIIIVSHKSKSLENCDYIYNLK